MADMTKIVPPKWWLDTKRGVGMAMLAAGQIVPVVGMWLGVSVDTATVGEFAATVATWFDVTWNVIGGALLIYGAFFPTAPLKLTRA
jgi:hypothetical protein